MSDLQNFSNSKQKLNKIWELNQANESSLNQKENKLKKLFKEHNIFKNPKVLYESAWVARTPVATSSVRSTKKGYILPESLAYDPVIEFNIPPEFLPFVKFDTLIKTVPNTELVGTYFYEQSDFSQDYVEVYGDSQLIYKGRKFLKTGRKFLHQQSEIDDGSIDENLTKKVFNGIVIYTQGGDTWKVEGELSTMILTFGISAGCNGNQQFTEYTVQIDPDLSNHLPYSKILNMDETLTSFIAKRRVVTWIDPGSGCAQGIVITENVSDTKSWSSVQATYSFVSAKKYKLIDGNFVQQGGIANYIVDERVAIGDVITERTFTFAGFWLYYSTDYEWLFGIGNTNLDGQIDDLLDIPVVPGDIAVSLPYTEITLLQNPGDFPLEITGANVLSQSQTLPFAYLLVSENDDGTNTYRIAPQVRGFILAPATEINPLSRDVDVFDDIYTISGSTYAKTTELHTTKEKITYVSKKQDAQVKVRLTVHNPFVYLKHVKADNE